MGGMRLVLWLVALDVFAARVLLCPTCQCLTSTVTANFYSYLEVTCNNLSLTEVPSAAAFANLSDNVGILDLAFNNITTITNYCFRGMDLLFAINLQNNHISEVQSKAFENLRQLTFVQLRWNKIKYLDPWTFYLNTKLSILDLSYNPLNLPVGEPFLRNAGRLWLILAACNVDQISQITFSYLRSLIGLELSSNKIKNFNTSVLDRNLNLMYLSLKNNSKSLTIQGKFPPSLEQLDLSGVDLYGNTLSTFNSLYSLEVLKLNSCNFTEIPDGAFDKLIRLEVIQLNNNGLKRFEKTTVHSLGLLERVHLENNSIEYIESNVFESTRLWRLNLNGNPINFPEKGPFVIARNLQDLEMRSCAITRVGNETFRNLKFLNYTDLSYNHIKRINHDVFSGLEFLTMLLLQHNDIAVIEKDAFLHNIRLTTLNLSGNPLVIPSDAPFLTAPTVRSLALVSCGITDLPEKTFYHFPHIISLDISHNNLTFINHTVFSRMRSLQTLNMSDNPFVCDYLLRPLWLQCLDRDIECMATCGSLREPWNMLESVTAPQEVSTRALTDKQPEPQEVGQKSSGSVAPTVVLMLSVGILVGVVMGLVLGCLFLQKYSAPARAEDAVYHSVAADSVTSQSLQHLNADDLT